MDGCGRIARKRSDDPSIAAVLLRRNILLLRASCALMHRSMLLSDRYIRAQQE
jgi:hypothetical protein